MTTEKKAHDRELTECELDAVSGGLAGIQALIAVTQQKCDNANDEALNTTKK